MVGFDTNVLLRLFLRNDDPAQSARAQRALEFHAPVYLNDVTLAEFAWVCKRTFKMSREEICERLDAILEAPEFIVAREDAVARAIDGCRARKSDFADLLVGESNLSAGCETTLTLDFGAAKSDAFSLVG